MAITVGAEYDHIDFTSGGNTVRHPLKDTTAREKAENLVAVQDIQPVSEDNVVWIQETPESEVQVPTYAEFSALVNTVSEITSEAMGLAVDCGTITALPVTMNATGVTGNHKAIDIEIGTSSALTSAITVTTGNGTITLSGTISGSTTCKVILIACETVTATEVAA